MVGQAPSSSNKDLQVITYQCNMWTTLVVSIGSGEHVYVSTPYICIALIFSSRAISECQVGLPAVTMICWLLLPTSSSMNMWTTLVVSTLDSDEHGYVLIPCICIALIFSFRVISEWQVGVPAATIICWSLPTSVNMWTTLVVSPGSGEHGYVSIPHICIALIFSSRVISGWWVGVPAATMIYWLLSPVQIYRQLWWCPLWGSGVEDAKYVDRQLCQ